MADYPKRTDWQKLKKKYSIPDGAVKNFNIGKELDAFHKAYDGVKGATAPQQRVVIAEGLEKKLAAYLSALSKNKKSYKLYTGFEREFLDDYVGKINFMKRDLKRYNADFEVYQAEITKFFAAVAKLEANKSKVTKDILEKFKSGPLRGLSAVGSKAKGVNTKAIDGWLGTINDGIQDLPAEPSRKQLDEFIEATVKTTEEVAKLARAQGLVK
jgi:cell division protein FtsB